MFSVQRRRFFHVQGSGQPCPQGSAFSDGCPAASAGLAQAPTLLDIYPFRPPWNVAAVDYRVGLPTGTVLTDWRTLSDPNLSVNTGNGLIQLSGDPINPNIFVNVDFSLGVGAVVYNPSGAANNITITNSKFGFPATDPFFNFIVDQNKGNLTIRYCTFDGTNEQQGSEAISAGGNLILEYCHFFNGTQHIVTYGTANVTKSVTYRYNFLDNMLIPPTFHMNYIQWGVTDSTITADISFNTSFQNTLGGAEGYQWDSFGTGGILASPQFKNNTMIARLSGATQTMSAMVHGTTTATVVTGTGLNNSNYFDTSGAFFAYYAATMTPARGWSSNGNIEMNDGSTITPP